MKNFDFKKGDHVCFNADASITVRVFECTHETDCKDFSPYEIRQDTYRENKDNTHKDKVQFANWAKNYPAINRGNPWKITANTCNSVNPIIQATYYDYNNHYLPGDFVTVAQTGASIIYVCVSDCDRNTLADVADSSDNDFIELKGSYTVEMIDYV